MCGSAPLGGRHPAGSGASAIRNLRNRVLQARALGSQTAPDQMVGQGRAGATRVCMALQRLWEVAAKSCVDVVLVCFPDLARSPHKPHTGVPGARSPAIPRMEIAPVMSAVSFIEDDFRCLCTPVRFVTRLITGLFSPKIAMIGLICG